MQLTFLLIPALIDRFAHNNLVPVTDELFEFLMVHQLLIIHVNQVFHLVVYCPLSRQLLGDRALQVWVDTSDPPLILVFFIGVAPTFGIFSA